MFNLFSGIWRLSPRLKYRAYLWVNVWKWHSAIHVGLTMCRDFLQKWAPGCLLSTLSWLFLSTTVQQHVTGLGGRLLSLLRAARPNTSFLTWPKWRESKQNNRAEKQHSKSAKNSKLDPVLPALSSQLVLGNKQHEAEHTAKTLPGRCTTQTKFIWRHKLQL